MITLPLLLLALASPRWDGPVLVVEAGHLIWPEKCQSTVPDGIADRLRATVGSAGLVFVGGGDLKAALPGEPVCLPGECGGAQVGLPLGMRADTAGVLLPHALVGKAKVHPFTLRAVDGADPYGEGMLVAGKPSWLPACGDPPAVTTPPGAQALADCRGYTSEETAIQVQGAGVGREEGFPVYRQVRFRVLEKKGQDWVPGAWNPLAGDVARLPAPVAALVEPKTRRIVWLSRQGACCPSASSAWITEVGPKGALRAGAVQAAGFGQTCD